MFFKEVVKEVLIFGSETWVMTPHMGGALGGVSTQGIQTYNWEVTKVAGGWELVIPTAGDGNSGGGFQGDGIVCYEESEYSRAIHCYAADYGPMRGDGADARGLGS